MIVSFTDVNRNRYYNRMLDMTKCRQQAELTIPLLRKSEEEKQIHYNLTERAITSPFSTTSGTLISCYRLQYVSSSNL